MYENKRADLITQKFLRSKIWKLRRLEILREDHYTCKDCEGTAREVHHLIELNSKNINDEEITLGRNNLISLCKSCHSKRTASSDKPSVRDGYMFDEAGQVVPVRPPGGIGPQI